MVLLIWHWFALEMLIDLALPEVEDESFDTLNSELWPVEDVLVAIIVGDNLWENTIVATELGQLLEELVVAYSRVYELVGLLEELRGLMEGLLGCL